MKLLSSYFKEMKIAARGFYFYIEVIVAIIIVAILLVTIKPYSDSKQQEFIYYDMSETVYAYMLQDKIDSGELKVTDSKEFKLKPIEFELTNIETGETESFVYEEEKTVLLEALQEINLDTGRITKTVYRVPNEEDMVRLAYSTGDIGATVKVNDMGESSYRYIMQGYETERFTNVLYILHTANPEDIEAQFDQQITRQLGTVERLNNREAAVPVMITFMGSLMGFFIIMSYIFLDKDEGVIRAFAVSPSAVWKYLISKIMVILTTVTISSSIIVIPVMLLKPNYLVFYPYLIITTFGFSALGMLISSFYDSISKAFGALYLTMIALILPAFSYYIPSFDPIWLRFFPTYPVLQGFKGILLGNPDMPYILTYSAAFTVGGILLLFLSNLKFKKSLTE